MSAILRSEPETSDPCRLLLPDVQAGPLILASPHSGRDYPADFVAESRLDPISLRRSEDSFVDELFDFAPASGVPLLSALFPRAYCDVNRERWELDPEMFDDALPDHCNISSRRVAAGFGTIARVVANGAVIHRRKLRFAEASARLDLCWDPYHAQLRALIAETVRRFGRCLLIDCHSMPGDLMPQDGRPPRFVLGDAFGSSCGGPLVEMAERGLAGRGYAVRRNHPYAGGFVTRHYGRPGEGVHVLQLEIARGLYMDERRFEKRRGFRVLREDLRGFIDDLVDALARRPELLAAG
jgi:N-formylglutamate deformylase